jgi:hypothetical protein
MHAIAFHPDRIPALHDQANAHGHDTATPAPTPANDLEALILAQHQANFDLWHTEDLARAPQVTGPAMIEIKHRIDHLNQLRNDLAEQVDTALLNLAPAASSAPLHSETPGLMIDRLSILALKIFHTAEEAHRSGATSDHHERQTPLAVPPPRSGCHSGAQRRNLHWPVTTQHRTAP